MPGRARVKSKVKGKSRSAASTKAHRGNRHGRSEEAREAILEAADDLLAERGFAALTMEGIALAAGVSKQTIYRWWKSKTDVLMDAFLTDVAQMLVPVDSGNLISDLRRHLAAVAKLLAVSDTGAVFRALIAEAQHDPALADRLRRQFIEPQQLRDRAPFELAVRRGELEKDFDVAAASESLVSPIYFRALVSGDAMSASYIEKLLKRQDWIGKLRQL